jgi:hypothetical protein
MTLRNRRRAKKMGVPWCVMSQALRGGRYRERTAVWLLVRLRLFRGRSQPIVDLPNNPPVAGSPKEGEK